MVRKTLIATVTVAANTPANMRQAVSFGEVGKPTVTRATVPKGRVWIIRDVFIKDTADVGVDGTAIFVKNEIEDVAKTSPLSTLLVSNPSRPPAPTIAYDQYETVSIDYVNIAAVGASPVTVTFYIIVDDEEKVAVAPRRGIAETIRAAFRV